MSPQEEAESEVAVYWHSTAEPFIAEFVRSAIRRVITAVCGAAAVYVISKTEGFLPADEVTRAFSIIAELLVLGVVYLAMEIWSWRKLRKEAQKKAQLATIAVQAKVENIELKTELNELQSRRE